MISLHNTHTRNHKGHILDDTCNDVIEKLAHTIHNDTLNDVVEKLDDADNDTTNAILASSYLLR